MNFKRTLNIIIAAILVSFAAKAQEIKGNSQNTPVIHNCILDELILKRAKETPDFIEKYVQYENEQRKLIMYYENGLLNNTKGTDTLINGRRIVPVVFHIMHKYGVENITREQVEDAIALLNLDYNKQNADTANTYPQFKSRAADPQIEFRLAKIDPWGNCTDGIVREYDPRTDYAYFNVMRDNSWPYTMYMNVYAVNFIYPEGMVLPAGALIGGLSPLTPDNNLSPSAGDTLLDGVLVRHDCVGSIGTATSMAGSGINNHNRVMTHETGHFFNLYHTFQNIMATLLGMDNCTHMSLIGMNGDEIDDTPPVKAATQGCPAAGSVNTCTTSISGYGDEPDMIENYMDYANGVCQNIFTTGQLSRINATMMGTRRNMWSYENLVATGVLDTSASLCAPIADFQANRLMVCEGTPVTFADFSYNAQATSWEWTFPGGTPATSTDQNPVVTYNTAGKYDVTLKTINANGDNTETKSEYIYVGTGTPTATAPFTEGFEQANVLNDYMFVNSVPGVVKWQRTTQAHASGSAALKLNSNNTDILAIDAVITKAFDLTNVPNPRLKFKIAYKGVNMTNPLTQETTYNYADLRVHVSTNCGQTWLPRKSITDSALTTAGSGDTTSFVPGATQWREEVVSALNSVAGNSNVMFKFEFKNRGGNNFYLDDINLYNDNVSIAEPEETYNMSLYPNPVSEEATLSFTLAGSSLVGIKVFDLLGREVSTLFGGMLNAGEHQFTLSKKNYPAGTYLVHLLIGTDRVVKPFSVL